LFVLLGTLAWRLLHLSFTYQPPFVKCDPQRWLVVPSHARMESSALTALEMPSRMSRQPALLLSTT
jgi:hypothetical protein